MTRLAALTLCTTGLSIVSCTERQAPVRAPIVRDSAGVRIVENFNDPVPLWQLAPSAVVDIGSATDTLFSLFEVEGAHRLSDGRIVIANRGTDELRFYDADGRYLHTAGRRGRGPGEFRYISWMARCGTDTLYVYDSQTRRLTVLGNEGDLIRMTEFMLPENTLPYGDATCQRGGPFVTAGWAREGPRPGVWRSEMPIGLIGLGGEPVVMIGTFPGTDRFGTVRDGRLSGSGPLPMGRNLLSAIAGDQVFVGTGDTYEVLGYDLTGELASVVRLNRAEQLVTEADVEAYINGRLSRIDEARHAETRRFYRAMEFPKRFPAYGVVVVDAEEAVWIQDYPRPNDAMVTWRRFLATGEYVGRTQLPVGLQVFEIGMDYVLGMSRDEFDVEHVQLFDFNEMD